MRKSNEDYDFFVHIAALKNLVREDMQKLANHFFPAFRQIKISQVPKSIGFIPQRLVVKIVLELICSREKNPVLERWIEKFRLFIELNLHKLSSAGKKRWGTRKTQELMLVRILSILATAAYWHTDNLALNAFLKAFESRRCAKIEKASSCAISAMACFCKKFHEYFLNETA